MKIDSEREKRQVYREKKIDDWNKLNERNWERVLTKIKEQRDEKISNSSFISRYILKIRFNFNIIILHFSVKTVSEMRLRSWHSTSS